MFFLSYNTPQISVISPNREKYGPEKTPYWNTFHAVNMMTPAILELATNGRIQPIPFQCTLSLPPKNIRKP